MRNPPNMPKLEKHSAAAGMDRVGHQFPPGDLVIGVNAGRPFIASALRAHQQAQAQGEGSE
jgi:hypothetical protein